MDLEKSVGILLLPTVMAVSEPHCQHIGSHISSHTLFVCVQGKPLRKVHHQTHLLEITLTIIGYLHAFPARLVKLFVFTEVHHSCTA